MPEGSFGTGPVPKKDSERRRRNKTPEKDGISGLPAEVINLDETIHGGSRSPSRTRTGSP